MDMGIIFIYLVLAVLGLFFAVCGLFYSCDEWRLLSSCRAYASHCSGFSCCQAQALGYTGFSSCGVRAQELPLLSSRAQAK